MSKHDEDFAVITFYWPLISYFIKSQHLGGAVLLEMIGRAGNFPASSVRLYISELKLALQLCHLGLALAGDLAGDAWAQLQVLMFKCHGNLETAFRNQPQAVCWTRWLLYFVGGISFCRQISSIFAVFTLQVPVWSTVLLIFLFPCRLFAGDAE